MLLKKFPIVTNKASIADKIPKKTKERISKKANKTCDTACVVTFIPSINNPKRKNATEYTKEAI